MDYKEIYSQWLENPYFDDATKEELRAIKDDENEIKERFYMDLEFGTAGLRGIIGAGTNRMNIYVVRRATQGLANYIAKVDKKSQGVAIAYDSRHTSLRMRCRYQRNSQPQPTGIQRLQGLLGGRRTDHTTS